MIEYLPKIGEPIEGLDTPALIIELADFEHNLELMHSFFRTRPVKVRSVTKSHKCPAIGQVQMATDGAVPFGIGCAKVSEAEVMAGAGAKSIRMIQQITGKQKIDRLMNLASSIHVLALADNENHIDELSVAASEIGVTIDVLVEVDIGAQRAGVQPGQPAVKLAQHIERNSHVKFAGITAHEGLIVCSDTESWECQIKERFQRLLNTREDVEKTGIPIEICGAGSTTCWWIAGSMEGITEVDPGHYALMDSRYSELNYGPAFRNALKMVTTVISRPAPDRAVIDCGYNSIGLAVDGKVPSVDSPAGVTVNRINNEAGVLDLQEEATNLRIGDKVVLVPRSQGTAVQCHDYFVGIRNKRVERLWEITARGSHR